MVVPNVQLSTVRQIALDSFDSFSHIAIGDDNTTPTVGDTTLGNETLRKALTETVKDLGAGTYRFQIRVALTEANGTTIEEIGIFDNVTGGNMGIRDLLSAPVVKTSDKEVVIILQVTITATNV